MSKRMPSFTGIYTRERILYEIKGIQHGKGDLRDDVVSDYRGVEW